MIRRVPPPAGMLRAAPAALKACPVP